MAMGTMTKIEIDELLGSAVIGVLCTVGLDGQPEGTPVWFDFAGDRVRILVHERSRKARNIRANPRVSLTVDTRVSPYRGVVVRGMASLSGPNPELRRALAERYLGPGLAARYLEKTRSLDASDVLITIVPTGRFSWDYSKGYGD
jgi:PPOX class probable F420-dependent enzyme